MILITLLLVLSIERVAATGNLWQFEFYYRKMKNLLIAHLDSPGWLRGGFGLLIWVLLPVALVQFVVGAADWLLLEFLFDVVVLLICIGCLEKRRVYKSFLNAATRSDEQACQLYAAKLQGLAILDKADAGENVESAEDGEREPSEQVLHDLADGENADDETCMSEEPCGCSTLGLTLVWYNFRYYCAVLFWFVCLGPAGAVLYCVVRETADDKDPQVRGLFPQAMTQRVLHILDWLPARVFSAGYLLIGHFNQAAGIWLSYLLDLTSSAKSLVAEISGAAEPVEVVDCNKVTEPACMLKLAKRNILFFLALVALLTLYGGLR